MDPDTDEDFLWIAKEALFAAVPEVSGDNNIRRSAIYIYIYMYVCIYVYMFICLYIYTIVDYILYTTGIYIPM